MASLVHKQSLRKPLKEPRNGLPKQASLTAKATKLPLAGEPPKFKKRISLVKPDAAQHFSARVAPAKPKRTPLRDWAGTKRLHPS